MLIYILKVTICLLGFYLPFILFLRRETYFRLNRIYLLGSVVLSMIIPNIELSLARLDSPQQVLQKNYIQPVVVGIESFEHLVKVSPRKEKIDAGALFDLIYWCGVCLVGLRFVLGIVRIRNLITGGRTEKGSGYVLVFHNRKLAPFSFFHYLFFNEELKNHKGDLDKIKRHEMAHAEGWHSFDVFFLEMLSIIFWCSPLIYLFKRSLRLQHEFIADASAIQDINKKQYGHLLIRQSLSGNAIAFANHFSLQLKKRFTMMKRKRSKPLAYMKYALAFPVLAVLIMAFANKEEQPNFQFSLEFSEQKEGRSNVLNSSNVQHLDQGRLSNLAAFDENKIPLFAGCSLKLSDYEQKICSQKKLYEYISQNLKYPAKAKEANIQGTVVVKFTIDEKGNVKEATIISSIDAGCDDEVLRIVKQMPRWTAAVKDGKSVSFDYTLPVKFEIPAKNSAELQLKDEDFVFETADEIPRFPGCEEGSMDHEERKKCAATKMLEFIYSRVHYPKDAREKGIEGVAELSFIVEKDGALTDFKVIRDVNGAFAKELKRIGNLLPKFTPGSLDGAPARVRISLPIRFKLPQKANKSSNGEHLANQLILDNFGVHPNPSEGKVNLRFKALSAPMEIKILDLNGKEVFFTEDQDFDGIFEQDIDLSNQPVGAYFLQIHQGKRTFTYKILLQ